MATSIGIVYVVESRKVAKVIVPDHDSQLDDPAWIGPGERMLRIHIGKYLQPIDQSEVAEIIASVEARLGR